MVAAGGTDLGGSPRHRLAHHIGQVARLSWRGRHRLGVRRVTRLQHADTGRQATRETPAAR